jgi:hypothetical protein
LTADGRRKLAADAKSWHRLTVAMEALGLTSSIPGVVA